MHLLSSTIAPLMQLHHQVCTLIGSSSTSCCNKQAHCQVHRVGVQVAVVDAAGEADKAQSRTAALEQRVRQLQRQVQDCKEAEAVARQQLQDMRVRCLQAVLRAHKHGSPVESMPLSQAGEPGWCA